MIEIPGYSVIGQIGRGGMATVYRARQTLLDREVALKVMSPQLAQDPVYAQRFLQEARMLAALNHPHVVPVYDVGVTPEGLHYFSMQMLGGGDFAARMREGLSELELVRVLLAVAHALGFAHARGYVHRDVTPANILFDAHDTPILTDFGIARAVASTSRITASGLSIGTSHYMSPEQARGAEVDHRSDIYSLGVLTFEAVSGQPPFEGDDGFAVAFAHVHDPVPRLPEEAARWQPLIDRAMAKDPADRYADCAAFIEGLRQIAPDEFQSLGPTVTSAQTRRVLTPPPQPSRPRPRPQFALPVWLRRRPAWLDGWRERLPAWPLLAGGAVALALFAFAGWLLLAPSSTSTPGAAIASKPATAAAVPPVKTDAIAPAKPAAADPVPGYQPIVDGIDETAAPGVEGDALATETGEPHTVIDPVNALNAMGQANIDRQRLTSPPVTNALERFQLALLIEPDNAVAAQGIADVAEAYLKLAAQRDPERETADWLELLAAAERVAAVHPLAAAKASAAAAARKAYADTQLERGRAALLAWDRPAATAAFEAVRRVLPESAEATRGLEEAARLGQVGYRFRDTWPSGRGPDMVIVVAGLALGRHEVSVAEFGEWWTAVGKAKFAGSMPSCRDREKKFFGTSRSRTWTAPDITQDARHPVVCVSQPMAKAYVDWLAERSGKPYRLPTAAELSPYLAPPTDACAANLRDASFRNRFGGREGASCDDGHAETAPIGSFAAGAGALHDAYGNVREWTSDCSGNCRDYVVVGLSWLSSPGDSLRESFEADTGHNTVGFRVARDVER